MNENNPSISVIIPVYNGAAFIGEALASIAAQHYTPLEIIVVDDGSTDTTAAAVQSFAASNALPLHYLYQPNRGPAAARNAGIALAQGVVLAFLDADDRWSGDKLQIQLPLLQGPPAASVVMGWARFFCSLADEAGGVQEKVSEPVGLGVVQAMLCWRSVFERVGLFNPDLRLGEDTDWLLRLREANLQLLHHSDVVLLYRRHADNITKHTFGQPIHLLQNLRRSLARRRVPGSSGVSGAIQPRI